MQTEQPSHVDLFARDPIDPSVCVVDGYGVRVSVERRHLVVVDGIAQHRRERRYARATHGLRRLVVLGHTGAVSLDALRWCRRLGIQIAILDTDGSVQFASIPNSTDDARLRRAQAAAPRTEHGLTIARELLDAKLAGHAAIVRNRFLAPDAADRIDDFRQAVGHADRLEDARRIEAAAAAAYWSCWIGRDDAAPIFATRDRTRIPSHWTVFEGRRSVLAAANGNRRAERPTNALVNYCNALAEIEAKIACTVVGLDAGLGILHLDTRNRGSLALDLLEPLRPLVETFVLDLLADRTFRHGDFTETPDGHVRVLAPLTHELAESAPRWANAVGPYAERVAHLLGASIEGAYSATTPLTAANLRTPQALIKTRRAPVGTSAARARRQRPSPTDVTPTRTNCVACGAPVERKRHLRCPACQARQPGQDEATRRKRARAIAARRAELERWRSQNPDARTDPDAFRREILPGLADVKLADIIAACGVAKSTASMIRSGSLVPALRHWPALATLGRQRR